jgi:O-antigen/teichoic acid export membrane protein
VTAKIAPEPDVSRYTWTGARAPGRDLVRFGLAIAAATVFSAVQLFVVPRRVDVATYGHYRLFLLYVSYCGLLHAGVADGAFLRWAGRPARVIREEWKTVGRWLLAMHVIMLVVATGASLVVGTPLTRLFLLSLVGAALCANAATLASFALQASGDFRGAGRVAALAPGAFVALVVALPIRTLSGLFGAYALSCGVAAVYGAIRVLRLAPHPSAETTTGAPLALRALSRAGLPVLGANLAAGLSQSVDRILVSATTPITSFALYGFASTVAVVGATITHTFSRVALSHAAMRPAPERARFLARLLDVVAAGFGTALVAEPLFERLVSGLLPNYVNALPIVRAMVVGLPFAIATHVVLVGTLQAHELVRRQLMVELCGVALVAGASGAALVGGAPLWGVAAAASAASLATFMVGGAVVRRVVVLGGRTETLRFVLIVAAQGAALLVAVTLSHDWAWQTAAYAVLSAIPTAIAWSRARVSGW